MYKYFFIVVLSVVLLTGYRCFFVIQETEQVVITEFGKPVQSIQNAWQKTHYFDRRILKIDGEPNEIPTSDKTFFLT